MVVFYCPEFSRLWEYWLSICGDAMIPDRENFNPANLTSLLSDIGILDWDGEKYYLRLLGTSAIDELGIDFSGPKSTQMSAAPVRDFVMSNFKTIFNFSCGLQAVVVERGRAGLVVEAAILFLPMATGEGKLNQALTCRRHLTTLGYDGKYPDLIQLGINRMNFIDLGSGVPDIDLEAEVKKTLYIAPGWESSSL
ncbi:PAS domain-containing protein [Emcibacter nanhaiensis]